MSTTPFIGALCVSQLNSFYMMTKIQIKNKRAAAVGIQTAALLVTLWIYYGHPAYIKRAGCLFEFHLSIILAVI